MECLTKIYSLSCPQTGDVRYIGKTILGLNYRRNCHIQDSKRGKNTHKNIWIRSLLKKGLLPIIEIIDEVEDWIFWEMHYISLFKSWGCRLTNHTIGGEGVPGLKQSAETIKKRMRYGKDHWSFGKKQSAEQRKKLSESHMGRKHTKEQREALSKRMQENHPMKGKKLTQDHRNKIIESWKHRPFTSTPEETKKRMSEAAKIGWAKRKQKQCAA